MSDDSPKNLASSSKSISFSPPTRNHSKFSINLLFSPEDKNPGSLEDVLNNSMKSTSRFSKDFENLNKLTEELSPVNQAKTRKIRPILDKGMVVSQRNSVSENSANIESKTHPFTERRDVHSNQINEENLVNNEKSGRKKHGENMMTVKDGTSPYIYILDTNNQQAFSSPRITDKTGINSDLSNPTMKVSSQQSLENLATTHKEHNDINISVKRYDSNSSEEQERSYAKLKSMTLNYHNRKFSSLLSPSKIMISESKKNKRNNNYDQPFSLKQFSGNNDNASRRSQVIPQIDLSGQQESPTHQSQLNLQTRTKASQNLSEYQKFASSKEENRAEDSWKGSTLKSLGVIRDFVKKFRLRINKLNQSVISNLVTKDHVKEVMLLSQEYQKNKAMLTTNDCTLIKNLGEIIIKKMENKNIVNSKELSPTRPPERNARSVSPYYVSEQKGGSLAGKTTKNIVKPVIHIKQVSTEIEYKTIRRTNNSSKGKGGILSNINSDYSKALNKFCKGSKTKTDSSKTVFSKPPPAVKQNINIIVDKNDSRSEEIEKIRNKERYCFYFYSPIMLF